MAKVEETDLELFRTVDIPIGSDGTGTSLPIGPDLSWERWEIETISTVCTSGSQTTFYIRRQFAGNNYGEGTYSGNLDSTNTPYKLMAGQKLVFSYEKGDQGSRGTVTIMGRRFLRGNRAYGAIY